MTALTIDEQLAYLTKGCVDVVRAGELKDKLEKGRPLTVKVGFDPTAPDLHLGHTVLLRKMKHFQELGHRVVFVVGDFTAMIGDPTGRSKTRPPLSTDDIAKNAETYKAQVFKILDREKTVVDFNARWLHPLGAEGLIRLAAHYQVAQMLERRHFKQRYEGGQPIAIHEFLYPLVQAYDSVFLKADVELGGTDQLFNLNVGRDIMPSYGLTPQIVMTTPLLEGLDGVEKMSKSLGNYVGVTDAPGEMFGKIMSISDELMWRYYLLLTDLTPADIAKLKADVAEGKAHPRQVKVDLARRIVTDFHSADAAAHAADSFDARFARGELVVGDLPVVTLDLAEDSISVAKLVAGAGLAASVSEATRKIQQGGVKVDRQKVVDIKARVDAARVDVIVEVGRRGARVTLRGPGRT
jgi:tyrosyl-tRNA synthetase